MRRKNIYPIEWVKYHPYKTPNQVDNYYADLADKVFNVIYDSVISDSFDNDKETIKEVAIHLTMWFEDLASETGVWKAATSEFKKRYGSLLPFYELGDDYEAGFVNIEDVRFLLWNELQCFQEYDLFINPENPGIEEVANDIFPLFDAAWEDAPVNGRLYSFIHNPEALDSYWKAREIIEWFAFHAFVNTNTEFDTLTSLEELYKEDEDAKTMDLQYYFICVISAFCHKRNMLSITAPQWLARIRSEEEREVWESVKWKHVSIFRFYDENETQVFLTDLVYDEEFAVEKESFNEEFMRKTLKINDILYCSLVSFRGGWYQCGQLVCLKMDNKLQGLIDEKRHNLENLNYQSTLYPKFKELTGGKKIVFLGSLEELRDFYKKMGFKEVDESINYEIEENCVLMCSPINGLVMFFNEAACICSEDNPFYDKAYAKENAHQFYFCDDLIDYREACDLHDGNYLPDAQVSSLKGDEYGNWFLHKHGQYIIDYFFSKTREYDYDAKFDLSQIVPKE